jgi:hypothetical protein
MGKIPIVEFNDDASVVASGALFDLVICFQLMLSVIALEYKQTAMLLTRRN